MGLSAMSHPSACSEGQGTCRPGLWQTARRAGLLARAKLAAALRAVQTRYCMCLLHFDISMEICHSWSFPLRYCDPWGRAAGKGRCRHRPLGPFRYSAENKLHPEGCLSQSNPLSMSHLIGFLLSCFTQNLFHSFLGFRVVSQALYGMQQAKAAWCLWCSMRHHHRQNSLLTKDSAVAYSVSCCFKCQQKQRHVCKWTLLVSWMQAWLSHHGSTNLDVQPTFSVWHLNGCP